jgi:hypothetical protein
MTDCDGTGFCFEQCCGCICYDDIESDNPEILSEICTCGHRNHPENEVFIGSNDISDKYCRKEECKHNCTLKECHNYRLCETKHPECFLNCHNGMCLYCAMSIGKIIFTGEMDECHICMDMKELIRISCNLHKLCLDCWKKMSDNEERTSVMKCPFCRKSIW